MPNALRWLTHVVAQRVGIHPGLQPHAFHLCFPCARSQSCEELDDLLTLADVILLTPHHRTCMKADQIRISAPVGLPTTGDVGEPNNELGR